MAGERTNEGYLLLADISGYTAFLTGNELEHAHGIIEDLTREIIASFPSPWRLVKIEGDAVFVYADGSSFTNAERVMESVDRCYCAFADLRDDIQRATSCQCTACSNIHTLDLKFVAHYGTYLKQTMAGTEDLAGPSVILVHRLLKNTICESAGVRAYAFYTMRVVERAGRPLDLPTHTESYDSLGEVTGIVADLGPLPAAVRDARRVRVEQAEADFSFSFELPVSQAVAWDYFTNSRKMERWSSGATGFEDEPAQGSGRTGVGSAFHCAHGSGRSVNRYQDWRPFSYFTSEKSVEKSSMTTPPPMLDTTEFTALGPDRTRVDYRFRVSDRGFRSRARIALMKPIVRHMFRTNERRLRQLLEEEGHIAPAAGTPRELEVAAAQ